MQLKEGAPKKSRLVFFCMGQDSCPEVTVPGGWICTVGDKATLLPSLHLFLSHAI